MIDKASNMQGKKVNGFDHPDGHLYFACGKNVTMDFISKISSGNSSFNDHSMFSSDDTAEHRIRQLLSTELSTQGFYFVRAEQKQVAQGSFDYSAGDCNGFVSSQDKDCESSSVRPDSVGSNDQSVFGSPLKLQAIADLSMKYPGTSTPILSELNNKSKYDSNQGMPLKEARRILSKFNQTIDASAEAMTVILCDGEDRNKTFLIGSHKKVIDGRIALKTFNVVSSRVKLSAVEEPSETNVRGYSLTGRYRILDEKDGLGSIVLEARWTDPLGSIKLQRLQSTEFYLHVKVASGCDQSAVFSHFCQLQKVKGLVEGLKTGELPEVFSEKPFDALKELRELFAKVKLTEQSSSNIQSAENGKTSLITGMLSGTTRQLKLDSSLDSDFTDQLWHVISFCADFSDMIRCLNATFGELRKGELKPFVHKDNDTTIAKLVMQSYSGMASFPSLIGCLPLRLIAEIGIEKIRKEYNAIFINSGLCTAAQWNSFFQALTPVSDDIIDMEEFNIQMLCAQLSILGKLHHCLEIVSTVDSFTASQDLASITRHVMKFYKTEDLDESHSFTVPITALQASPEIQKLPLSYVRRESTRNDQSTVDTLTSELPEGPSCPSLSSSDPGNVSAINGDSREFVFFKAREQLFHI